MWLVKVGTVLDVEPPEDLGDITDVVTTEPSGLRITRRLPRPSLGRRARERQVQEVQDAIDRDGAALDDTAARSALVASWRRELEVLEAHVDVLADGDPATEHARLGEELAVLERSVDDGDEAYAALARSRLDSLRRSCRRSGSSRVGPRRPREPARLVAGLPRSQPEELARIAGARATLAELIDVLRSPPPATQISRRQASRAGELATASTRSLPRAPRSTT